VFGAIIGNRIKRFLAYAAINQVGLLLLGVYLFTINATLFYLITYMLTIVAFFVVLVLSFNSAGLNEGSKTIVYLTDLTNLAYFNKRMAAFLIIILFAMAGLPPFITSIGK